MNYTTTLPAPFILSWAKARPDLLRPEASIFPLAVEKKELMEMTARAKMMMAIKVLRR